MRTQRPVWSSDESTDDDRLTGSLRYSVCTVAWPAREATDVCAHNPLVSTTCRLPVPTVVARYSCTAYDKQGNARVSGLSLVINLGDHKDWLEVPKTFDSSWRVILCFFVEVDLHQCKSGLLQPCCLQSFSGSYLLPNQANSVFDLVPLTG